MFVVRVDLKIFVISTRLRSVTAEDILIELYYALYVVFLFGIFADVLSVFGQFIGIQQLFNLLDKSLPVVIGAYAAVERG